MRNSSCARKAPTSSISRDCRTLTGTGTVPAGSMPTCTMRPPRRITLKIDSSAAADAGGFKGNIKIAAISRVFFQAFGLRRDVDRGRRRPCGGAQLPAASRRCDYGSGEGGGGGSIIDSSAFMILAEVSGVNSPNDPNNGQITITAIPTPLAITPGAALGFTNGVFGFNLIGPSGSNVVIEASTDLQTWIALQTNLLGGLFYFSDPQSTTNVQRFYRAQLSP